MIVVQRQLRYILSTLTHTVVVIANANCKKMPDGGPRNSSRKKARCSPAISLSFEHCAGNSTSRLRSTPILRENTLEGVKDLHPLPPTSRKDMRLDGNLEYPHATETLYIFKHSCLVRDSNPGPTAPQ
ncbi:uncharacterized protein TNCV_3595271 [Trichonephila clavipes]|nr:uncharacterized protein TNCV_3595271 [Trichonephila clavipes]